MIKILDETSQRIIQSSIQIQSPVTVLKELLDNAVDADSHVIKVELKGQGLDLISVQDDGHGISQQDLELLGNKRVTSKDANQQQAGFRGEALFVIAAISNFYITSKIRSEIFGSQICLNDSLQNLTYCDVGTKVEVKNLFHNLPVRQNYMKTQCSNLSKQINKFLYHYVLAYRQVQFHVINAGKLLLSTINLEDNSPSGMFQQLFGEQQNMIQFEAQCEYHINAYISNQNGGIPQQNQQKLFIILNNKPVLNESLQKAFKKVYKEKSALTQPIGVVYLTTPNGTVDFNVSADKTEVKIIGEDLLCQFISKSYKDELDKANVQVLNQSVFQGVNATIQTQKQRQNNEQQLFKNNFEKHQVSKVTQHKSLDFQLKPAQNAQQKLQPQIQQVIEFSTEDSDEVFLDVGKEIDIDTDFLEEFVENVEYDNSFVQTQSQNIEQDAKQFFSKLKVLGQFNNSFILTSFYDQIFILDQHSLHEAINFEILKNKLVFKSQILISKQKLNLTTEQKLLLLNQMTNNRYLKNGFECVCFEDEFFLQKVGIVDNEVMDSNDFLEFLEEEYPKKIKQILANRACKSSIRLGDPLNISQMEELILQASEGQEVWNCPHGRPVVQKIL